MEHHLKKVVEKVIKERKKNETGAKSRKPSAKFYITAIDSNSALSGMQHEDNDLTHEERERVIELLLGQDRVIALLYDRNGEFSPDMNTQAQ